MEYDQTLDVCGLCCAEPIIRITKAMKGAVSGEVLLVTADKTSMLKDVPAYCRQTTNDLIHQQESQGKFQFWIRKN
ncbi:sulfurtransferase TusA family protein [Sulfuriferula sp.]|uniref:sulfurtransferase TusA family protein n=1 Tax=Sulfuriferula sp. TaxID=2025307 RepID=UPI0027305167|nr:sulfurtransferase TusA family protein [Sulfuriferula sp.]MDP2024707.1 sulfurtransferase TusA family protein [Sulfuriferula sp.]